MRGWGNSLDCFRDERTVHIVSASRAKKLIQGMRLHHLGFCLFWAVTFVALSGFRGGAVSGGSWHAYLAFEQVALPVAVGALAGWCMRSRAPLPFRSALLAGSLLSGGVLLYFFSFQLDRGDIVLACMAGALLGCSCALFFLLWQTFFATEGQQHAMVYIPVSAALSVILYLLIGLLPMPMLALVSIAVLPFMATYTLEKSLSEVEMYPIEPFDRMSFRSTVRDLWRPVFCASAIGFMWKLVSNLPLLTSMDGYGSYATLLGFGAAALLVAFLELFLSRGFAILQVYQVLFPLITGVFLLPVFFGERYAALLSGMLMLGFEVVNLLLIITCAVYSARHARCPIALYGLCIVPVLTSLALGGSLGSMLSPLAAFDFAFVVNVLFVCIYLLSFALLLASRGRASEAPASIADEELAAFSGGGTDAYAGSSRLSTVNGPETMNGGFEATRFDREAATDRFLREGGLSTREMEVAGLLLRGHTMAAIACKLFISENTVRGHAKSIYRKFGVHSRQELVDRHEEALSE